MNTHRAIVMVAILALIVCAVCGCGKKGGDGDEEGGAAAVGGGGPEMAGGGGPAGPPGGGPSEGEGAKDSEDEAVVEEQAPKLSDEEVAELLADAKQAKSDGDIEAAFKALTDIVKSKAEHVEANWMLAWVLAEKDDVALAIGQFERVMKLGIGKERAKEAAAAVERLRAKEE